MLKDETARNARISMTLRLYFQTCLLVFLTFQPLHAKPNQNPDEAKASLQSVERDGQHDFDFAIGRWRTHLSRLRHPLAGSNEWVDYEGSSVVRKVWGSRANLEEFEAYGASGHIEGLTLRLYNPQSHQWNQSWSTSDDGTLSQPMIGKFIDRHGEFFDQESFQGRMIYVRWVWSEITPNSCRFEQSFSNDGGKSWEVNWINVYTRVDDAEKKR
jgi:hypothetical protein